MLLIYGIYDVLRVKRADGYTRGIQEQRANYSEQRAIVIQHSMLITQNNIDQ